LKLNGLKLGFNTPLMVLFFGLVISIGSPLEIFLATPLLAIYLFHTISWVYWNILSALIAINRWHCKEK